MKTMSLRMPDEVHAALKEEAAAQGRTVNAEAVHCLHLGLDEEQMARARQEKKVWQARKNAERAQRQAEQERQDAAWDVEKNRPPNEEELAFLQAKLEELEQRVDPLRRLILDWHAGMENEQEVFMRAGLRPDKYSTDQARQWMREEQDFIRRQLMHPAQGALNAQRWQAFLASSPTEG